MGFSASKAQLIVFVGVFRYLLFRTTLISSAESWEDLSNLLFFDHFLNLLIISTLLALVWTNNEKIQMLKKILEREK